MLRVLTQASRIMSHPPINVAGPRSMVRMTPIRPRPTAAVHHAQQQQVRESSSHKSPKDAAKLVGKFTAGGVAFLAGSSVAIGVVIPTVIDVWARATSSMYVWTETTIERTEMRYYRMRGRMREAKEARQKRIEDAATPKDQTR